jgi:hypothetical protein
MIELKGVKIFSIFFIDIIKVTEVQYAILIIKMTCFTVEALNDETFNQTIPGYATLMYLEKEIHCRYAQR